MISDSDRPSAVRQVMTESRSASSPYMLSKRMLFLAPAPDVRRFHIANGQGGPMPANDSTRTRRLVLKQRDWTEAGGFAEQRGWPEVPTDDSGTGRESRVWSVDESTVFQVTRDRASGEFCCFFYGSDREELVGLLGEADQELDVWRIPELLNEPFEETDPRRLVRSIFRLGLGAPPVHSLEFMPPLANALAHEHSMVRAAAARTTAYMEWPELFPIVKTMAESDADQRVRAEAEKIVTAYHRAGLGDA
ncbi:HEAT repeat domain-containing protein [Streptosporangium sp. KLBMP 9127]|nr:HEAT repeat domain-containing protein [Streptosporangium sp. KLBMP 9127]